MGEGTAARIRELFDELVEQPADVRAARLDQLAVESPAVAERLRRLLSAHERATSFGSLLQPDGKPAVPPETIGRYRLLDRLGEGGMGVVYLAEQREPVKRRVAIKVIRPGMASKEVIRRFEVERQALALMSHPGIARILDAGETDQGMPYVVMEHVQGLPLLKYCDERRLDIPARLELMQKICHAVQHAHQKGVIHRDLKPSNILVTEVEGTVQPKVIDFGIAKAVAQPLTDTTVHTRFGVMVGTPDYMSPEQCASGNVDIDTRSDIYSLGAILFELLSGQLPYGFSKRKLSEASILQELRDKPPSRLSSRARRTRKEAAECRGFGSAEALARRLAGELEWIVDKAVAPERSRRYETAQALADDIGRYLDNEPVLAAPPSTAYRFRKFIARHTVGVTSVATAAVFLVAFAVTLAHQLDVTARERDRATRAANVAREVTDFTTELFELANPATIGRADVTARELLDAGITRIDTDRIADEEVRAAMLESAGRAYHGMGDHERAGELITEAHAIRERHADDNPGGLVDNLLALADVAINAGDYPLADEHASRARAIIDENPEETGNLELKAATLQAKARRFKGDLAGGAALLAPYDLLGETDDRFPAEDRAAAIYLLADIHYGKAEYDRAARVFQRVVSLEGEMGDRGSDRSRQARAAIARVKAQQGDTEAALAEFRELVALTEQVYGRDHTEYADVLNSFAAMLTRIPGEEEKSGRLWEQALAIRTRVSGRSHPVTLSILSNLGWWHHQQGDFQASRQYYEEVVESRRRVLGAEHHNVANAEAGLARALFELGDHDDALRLQEHALEILTSSLGPDHWRTAFLARRLGIFHLELDHLDEAEELLVRSSRIIEATFGVDSPEHEASAAALDKLARRRQAVLEMAAGT